MENLQKAINRAKELGWEVHLKKQKDYYYLCFSNYTPYGQDISEEFDFNGTFKDLLQQLIDSKAWIDINQGLDIRLMTEEKAKNIVSADWGEDTSIYFSSEKIEEGIYDIYVREKATTKSLYRYTVDVNKGTFTKEWEAY